MASTRKNRALYIDEQALSALALAKAGLLAPVDRLMTQQDVKTFKEMQHIGSQTFPFPFLLSPSGKRNTQVLETAQKEEILDLFVKRHYVGWIKVEEIFPIDKKERLRQIYGTDSLSHPGISATAERIGPYCIAGEYEIDLSTVQGNIDMIERAKIEHDAQHVSAIMLAANPLHRGHERLIRQSLEKSDLLILFLLKPYQEGILDYEIRYKTLHYFVTNYLPKNRVLIVPFETNYLFAGYNEVILDAIVAKNYGCDRLIIGKNHAGIGLFYDHNQDNSILNTLKGVDIEIETVSDFVYCNSCKTLVSTRTCPHGQHHHISYHADSILELMQAGLLPPAVLIRKDISALILSHLFPNRFKNIGKLYYDILPNSGILESHNEQDFYIGLMNLYQTTSLT
ncbi:MAG: sulfate adenylyltransferase [Sulfuricurvum sp. PC08-66]|nr:MAG: sulfate adenylyltransferase [Sulfuricurvum sp. PC08-66]